MVLGTIPNVIPVVFFLLVIKAQIIHPSGGIDGPLPNNVTIIYRQNGVIPIKIAKLPLHAANWSWNDFRSSEICRDSVLVHVNAIQLNGSEVSSKPTHKEGHWSQTIGIFNDDFSHVLCVNFGTIVVGSK
jgi:hypothetical protein